MEEEQAHKGCHSKAEANAHQCHVLRDVIIDCLESCLQWSI